MNPRRFHFKPLCLCLLSLALLLLSACSTSIPLGSDVVREREGDCGLKTRSGPGIFIGVSHPQASLADARDEALRNARSAIINSIESRLSYSLVDSLVTQGNSAEVLSADVYTNSRLQCLASNVIAVRANAFYTEHHELHEAEGLRYYYMAWCEVEFSRDQHTALLEAQVRRFEEQMSPGSLPADCWLRFGELLLRRRGLCGLRENYSGFTPGQLGRLDRIDDEIRRALNGIELGVRLSMVDDANGLQVPPLQRRLASELGHLLPLRVSESAGAPLLLQGQLCLEERDVNRLFYLATLEMNLSLLQPASGRTLLSVCSRVERQADSGSKARSLLFGNELDRLVAETCAQLSKKLGL